MEKLSKGSLLLDDKSLLRQNSLYATMGSQVSEHFSSSGSNIQLSHVILVGILGLKKVKDLWVLITDFSSLDFILKYFGEVQIFF